MGEAAARGRPDSGRSVALPSGLGTSHPVSPPARRNPRARPAAGSQAEARRTGPARHRPLLVRGPRRGPAEAGRIVATGLRFGPNAATLTA